MTVLLQFEWTALKNAAFKFRVKVVLHKLLSLLFACFEFITDQLDVVDVGMWVFKLMINEIVWNNSLWVEKDRCSIILFRIQTKRVKWSPISIYFHVNINIIYINSTWQLKLNIIPFLTNQLTILNVNNTEHILE